MENTIPPYSESESVVCKRICRFDPTNTYCIGCYRTPEEIKEWNSYSLAKQNIIIEILSYRQKEVSLS